MFLKNLNQVVTYREIFCQLQLLPRKPNSLEKKLESQVKNQSADHHDGNEAYDLRPDNHYTKSQSSQHDTGEPAVSSGTHEENSVGIDEVVLDATSEARDEVGSAVKLQLTIEISVIFACLQRKGRDVDGDM